LVISDTFTVSPTVINEIRFGGNRRNFTRNPESVGQGWASQLGIPGVAADTMPDFRTATGGTLMFEFPGGASQEIAENMSIQENLTVVRGRHTLKTGYELMRTRHNVRVATTPSGVYSMGGTEFPFRPNTGNPFASFMLGSVTSATFNRDLATWLPRWWGHAFYFQDDWKFSPKLSSIPRRPTA
jgi:outer membrane receptor protein involved in Fe transport